MSADQFLRSPAFLRWLGAGAILIVLLGVIRIATHNDSSNSPTSGRPSGPGPTPISTGQHRHHHHHGTKPTTAPTPTIGSSTVAPVPQHQPSTGTAPTTSVSQPSGGGGGGGGGGESTPTSQPTHTSTSSSGGSSIVVPKFGSYPYATSGSQSALGNSSPYPKKTTIKIARDGKCVRNTWAPTSNHQEVQVVCPKGSSAVRLKSESQTIFGQSQTLTCDSKAIVYSVSLKAGDTWTFSCQASGATAKQRAKAVGFQTFSIGGKSVRALHVHVVSRISGGAKGSSVIDYWYAPSLGMLVKQSERLSASSHGLTYRSQDTLTLTSTTPH